MKIRAIVALSCLLLFTCGCGDDDDPVRPSEPDLAFSISFEPATLTLGGSVQVTVAVTNDSDKDVFLGTGSSSCALTGMVAVGNDLVPMLSGRACTADVVDRYLGAGETRTESWEWEGDVWLDGVRTTLPAGTYQVHGATAYHGGEPQTFTIRDPVSLSEAISLWLYVDPALVHRDRAVTVEVRATNQADSPVMIGLGSCLLGATVEYDGLDHAMITDRICTADATPQYIDPGETRTESWSWDGRIRRRADQAEVVLPPGVYPVTGRVGDVASRRVMVEVTENPIDPPRFDLTIAVDPPVLAAGGTVEVTATATNTGTTPVTLHSSSSCWFGGLVNNGRVTYRMIDDRWCLMQPETVILQTGESKSGGWNWNGEVLFLGRRIVLPAGTYEVAATINGYIGNPVTIEIRE